MEPEASDSKDLVALVQVATYWRLRLRNVAPETGKPLETSKHPDFLEAESAEYSTGEKRFYECMERIQNQILNAQVTSKELPLESLLPLAALLRIVLDNRDLNADKLICQIDSPYRQDINTYKWEQLDVYWHTLGDQIRKDLRAKLNYWIFAPWIKGKAEGKYSVTLQEEHLADALLAIWDYLNLSLKGQPSIRGKDCIFNPNYQQRGQNCTVDAWLKVHLSWKTREIAKKLAEEQQLRAKKIINHEDEGQTIDPLDNLPAKPVKQAWWEEIREAVEGPFAEELQNITPRARRLHHITAQLVILNRLPPEGQTWEELGRQWECSHTTVSRFYRNYCTPWLRERFAELEDLL